MNRLVPCAVAAGVVFPLLTASPARSQESIIDQMQKAHASLVEVLASNYQVGQAGQAVAIDQKTGRLLVARQLAAGAYQRQGAGVIVHPEGVIVTNAHTIYKADDIKVTLHDHRTYRAEVLHVVNEIDLALLKIHTPAALPAVPLADSDEINLGDEIFTVGNSPLLQQTLSAGRVKGLGTHRSEKAGGPRTDLIQTTINLYQGDSGGPLFDSQGRLVGLMTASETAADHSSFAVPANRIAQYLNAWLVSRKSY